MDPSICPHTPDHADESSSVPSVRVDPAQALPRFPAPTDREAPDPEHGALRESGPSRAVDAELPPVRPHLGMAVAGTILFFPVGIFALWQSLRARRGLVRPLANALSVSAQTMPDAETIQRAGHARTLSIIAVCVGAVGWLLVFPICLLVGFGLAVNGGGVVGTRIIDVTPAPGAQSTRVELSVSAPSPARFTVLRADQSEFSDSLVGFQPIPLEVRAGDYVEIQVVSDEPGIEVSCTVKRADGSLATQHGVGFALCGVAGVE